MFYKYCIFNKESKRCALGFAVANLISLIILVAVLTFITIFVGQGDWAETEYLRAILYTGAAVNLLFIPFSVILIVGIMTERASLIRVWNFTTVSQICVLLFINAIGSIIVTAKVNQSLGITSLAVLTVYLVFILECVVYISDYYINQQATNGDDGSEDVNRTGLRVS